MQPSWTAWFNFNEEGPGREEAEEGTDSQRQPGGRGGERPYAIQNAYAKDTGIVSRPQQGLKRIVAVLANAKAAVGISVSEAKTEIMRKQNVRGRCRSPSLQPAKCTNKWFSSCTWAGLSAQIGILLSRQPVDSRWHGRGSYDIRRKSMTARVYACG